MSNNTIGICCQPPQSVKPLAEQNFVKKTIKIVDAPKENEYGLDISNSTSPADQPKMKVIDDENNLHGMKLTDIALPHISVKTVECKKNEKPTTTIVIYKSKNGNRAPTAKVIVTKVRDCVCVVYVCGFHHVSIITRNFPVCSRHDKNSFLADSVGITMPYSAFSIKFPKPS